MDAQNNVLERLKNKEAELIAIIGSNYPSYRSNFKQHERKVAHAQIYLKEIEELMNLIEECMKSIDVKLVPKNTLSYLLRNADFYTEEIDAIFCKAYNIASFGSSPVLLVHTASLTTL